METAHTLLRAMDRAHFPHIPLVKLNHRHLEWMIGVGGVERNTNNL